MTALNSSLLDRSPQETARMLCLSLLEEAEEALARLERGGDLEALHDFRVALRRLRSAIRAYRPFLKGSLRRKQRGRLKELASSTNASRDREAQIARLMEKLARESEGEPGSREGAARLLARLQESEPAGAGADSLRRSFDSIHRSLRKSLSRLRLDLEADGETFLGATGDLVTEAAARLRRSIRAISSAEDGDLLHRARIEAKRLRYLLEPLAAEVPKARALVKEMKVLQDALGELQDARVLMRSLSEELERSALEEARRLRDAALGNGGVDAEAPSPSPGVLAFLREVREDRDLGYERMSRMWLGEASAPFFERVFALGAELSAASDSTPRRRFLLSEVPEAARERTPTIVQQGFFPGKGIQEEIRSERLGGRTRYIRAVRASNRSAEEAVARRDFEALWSVAPRKLERARYEVRDSGRTFWIDAIHGGTLVIAETEDRGELPLPEWLKTIVVKEVTRSKKYDWEALADARPRTNEGA